MNSLFGDATSVQPTPQQRAEAESLFSGNRSPPPLDIRSGRGSESAIPNLDIDPPELDGDNGKVAPTEGGEGVGGWISKMVKRVKDNGEGDSSSGKYKRIEQDDNEA